MPINWLMAKRAEKPKKNQMADGRKRHFGFHYRKRKAEKDDIKKSLAGSLKKKKNYFILEAHCYSRKTVNQPAWRNSLIRTRTRFWKKILVTLELQVCCVSFVVSLSLKQMYKK